MARRDDHPGHPATPGMNAAVARVVAGIEAGEHRQREAEESRRRAHRDALLGTALRRMTPARRAELETAFPELAHAVELAGGN